MRTGACVAHHLRGSQFWRPRDQTGPHTPLSMLDKQVTDGSQAIVQAANDDRYQKILERIKGVVFLGTPHKGSQLATVSQRWFFPSKDIRAVLAVDSKDLMSLDVAFRESNFFNMSKGVFCFYETRPSSYGPKFLGLRFIVGLSAFTRAWTHALTLS